MQYYHKPQNSDTSLIFKSIDKFMECIDQVYELRVIGGDPFMNKEMYKIINKLVKYEKAKNIEPIPRIIVRKLNCIKTTNARVHKIITYKNDFSTEILPEAIGLVFVLSIDLSISSSNHILIEADDPAPIAIAIITNIYSI